MSVTTNLFCLTSQKSKHVIPQWQPEVTSRPQGKDHKKLEKQENYEIMERLKSRNEKRRKNGRKDRGEKRDHERQIL
jgi:hypothetical protein